MQQYRYLVGRRVEVHYRSGDFYLSCAGTLASDDGEAIVVNEQFSSGGRQKTMEWRFRTRTLFAWRKLRQNPSM